MARSNSQTGPGSQEPIVENVLASLLQGQQELIARLPTLAPSQAISAPLLTLPRTHYEKPPLYNVVKLKKGVTDAVLQDWLAAVQAGDKTRQHCAQADRVMWAMTVLDDELQSDWRTNARALESQNKVVDMEAFYSFAKGEHLNPQAQIERVREELRTLKQGSDETPESLYTRWSDLHQRLGHQNYTTNPEDIWALTRCFNGRLARKLEDLGQEEPLDTAWKTITRAQKRWDVLVKRIAEKENRAKRFTKPLMSGRPYKRLRTDASKNDQKGGSLYSGFAYPKPPVQGNFRPSVQRSFQTPAQGSPQPSAQGAVNSNPQAPQASPTFPMTCYHCGEQGHLRKTCPKLPPTSMPSQRPVQAISQAPSGIPPRILRRRQRRAALIQELTAQIDALSSSDTDGDANEPESACQPDPNNLSDDTSSDESKNE